MKRYFTAFLLAVGISLVTTVAEGQEPGWSGPIVARGPMRAQIESTPIIYRPYRPFHFYGNTVRRSYYRGTAVPMPRDFAQGAGVFLRGFPRAR